VLPYRLPDLFEHRRPGQLLNVSRRRRTRHSEGGSADCKHSAPARQYSAYGSDDVSCNGDGKAIIDWSGLVFTLLRTVCDGSAPAAMDLQRALPPAEALGRQTEARGSLGGPPRAPEKVPFLATRSRLSTASCATGAGERSCRLKVVEGEQGDAADRACTAVFVPTASGPPVNWRPSFLNRHHRGCAESARLSSGSSPLPILPSLGSGVPSPDTSALGLCQSGGGFFLRRQSPQGAMGIRLGLIPLPTLLGRTCA
jgi:hypothetical protein